MSDLFAGAVAKRLTLVETITERSNQHEFQGVQPLRQLLGDEDRKGVPTRFIWLSDEQGSLTEDGFLSWSNVRKGKPRSPEYHLYYSTNAVTEAMAVGDLLVIALQRDGSFLTIVTPAAGAVQNQLLWLFGLEPPDEQNVTVQHLDAEHDTELGFAARYILDELSIEPEEPEADRLDQLIEPYGLTFPKTKVFSELARRSLPEVSAIDDPDGALVDWLDQEERLFRRLERRIVVERIGNGFQAAGVIDVDGFLSFSLSVQNRRKARAGQALENHLEAVFLAQEIRFARGAQTENRNKPDFLFPGANDYADAAFPEARLTMLGAKSTLKDRWRQVLSEARRIEHKHLLTLEPGISENQTDEMRAKSLQLVIPRRLHETFMPAQRDWLIDLTSFLELVRARQDVI
ncbi:MAG: type II restriction endonuclease [Brevundimonas sp.]|uniref:type II restriction endonuclease n=1 Tax=Brevundimonas sp. TaxID=1871086 RepID=UPI002487798F|nr:type II restriction endonuclease [Brevundimonas sp.]MDI1328420.1 type II restriction endonuclease [Brevundimonas sp.]